MDDVVLSTATAADVRLRLQAKLGYSLHEHVLTFGGRVLDDTVLLTVRGVTAVGRRCTSLLAVAVAWTSNHVWCEAVS